MPVDSAKHALQPLVSPVEMHPLGEAEAEHHIILGFLGLHQLISIQHVVTLRARIGGEVNRGIKEPLPLSQPTLQPHFSPWPQSALTLLKITPKWCPV